MSKYIGALFQEGLLAVSYAPLSYEQPLVDPQFRHL
jgi:hypothetical protein